MNTMSVRKISTTSTSRDTFFELLESELKLKGLSVLYGLVISYCQRPAPSLEYTWSKIEDSGPTTRTVWIDLTQQEATSLETCVLSPGGPTISSLTSALDRLRGSYNT
jgi:hypothetical protein